MKQPIISQLKSLRVLLAGATDSGKTTLISILTKGNLDNGLGSSRETILKYKTEKQSGHTFSISSHMLTYSSDGQPNVAQDNPEKLIHLIDTCGMLTHQDSSVRAMTSTYPDLVLVAIDATTGISLVTKEHIGLSIALRIPIMMVLTKIDTCTSDQLDNSKKAIKDLIECSTHRKVADVSDSSNTLKIISTDASKNLSIPIIPLSNVTGEGIEKLHELLFYYNNSKGTEEIHKVRTEMWVRRVYHLQEAGLVLEGVLIKGGLRKGQTIQLGPVKEAFFPVTVKEIRVNDCECISAQSITELTVNVLPKHEKAFNYNSIKRIKGLLLLSKPEPMRMAKSFDAEIVIVKNTELKIGSSIIANSGPIQKRVEVEEIVGATQIKQGDKGLIKCKLKNGWAYMNPSQPVIFRDSTTIAFGIVTKLYT